jgi:hypothetical protein
LRADGRIANLAAMKPSSLSLLVLSLTAAQVPAQALVKVVPPIAQRVDGNTATAFPFAYTTVQAQQIWDTPAVAKSVALIQGLAFRGDAPSAPMNAATLNSLTVALSHTSKTAATMSTTFASNRTGAATVIFTGNLNLPAVSPPAGGPTPFAVSIKPSTPFVFATPSGNLMLEFATPAATPQKTGWISDGHQAGGLLERFGRSGALSANDTLGLVAEKPSDLIPGGTVTVSTTTFFKTYPGILFLGSSDRSWGNLTLPLDLTGIGAPGNSLYTGIELAFPHSWQRTMIGWAAPVRLTIPNQSDWIGISVFAQAVVADSANQFGAVFSNGVVLGIGSNGPQPISLLGNYDVNATTGYFDLGQSGGGVIVEFSGVIN